MSEAVNRIEISGVITELQSLRYTPAGIPVVEFRLAHESERAEAGARRKVHAEIEAVAFEAQARLVAAGICLFESVRRRSAPSLRKS